MSARFLYQTLPLSSRPASSGWDSGSSWSAPTPAAAATPGVHLGQTPAFSAPTPAAVSQTPDADLDTFPLEIQMKAGVDPNWLFDPVLANYLSRLKIIVKGTKTMQYLDGDYENRTGRILAAQENPAEFEQTARIRFDNGEERSFIARYIVPQTVSKIGEDVLIIGGTHRGRVLVVREQPEPDSRGDTPVVVGTKHEFSIENVPARWVVPLGE
ncbi:hypothetical protein NLJ89_g9064 [Agrocybe chaxingu]|uniref:KOW domain-containing protein n=1 Tax=Agrocybe chaxingu TaxID=84603 RepID=A0A9W8JWG4_9AGAR|nr:hypothetical protein NLJ89_g9064 [Agrocybe chaxingu]